MAKFELDLDFVIEKLPRNGADLAISALESNRESLESMMDAGWHVAIRKKSHYHSRRFLEALRMCEGSAVAVQFLKRFLVGADAQEVNKLLMEKEPSDHNEVVTTRWALENHFNREAGLVFQALIQASKELGADLEKEFSYSVSNENGGKLGKHTLMSMLVGQSDNHMTNRASGIFSQDRKDDEPFHMKRVRSLIKVGVSFDKPTAAAMLQILKPSHTMKWMQFFKSEGAATATEMVKMVSRLKPNPEVLAIMQAEAAAEAVDSVLKVSPSRP